MIIDLAEPKCLVLAYVARREIETNRYPLAPQLGPLRSAIAKLVPGEPSPVPPKSPRSKFRHRSDKE
jgi:hypothetical protein